jgi:redox-sensitive bicupin YhaK (pirin superfamily)
MTTEVRRAADRFTTEAEGRTTRHSFSFDRHYDPANVGHALLVAHNDDLVAPGHGYDLHPHRDTEIVTWVLEGSLVHQDSTGHNGIIYPGLAQRMSAGTGILHSEKNDSWRLEGEQHRDPVHFVQMWVLPDTARIKPGFQQLDINDELARGGLVPIASGQGHDAAIAIRQRDAVLWGGRLQPGERVSVPDDRHVHVFVARGTVELEGAGTLVEGDAARLTGAGELAATAGPDGAEVLVWATA